MSKKQDQAVSEDMVIGPMKLADEKTPPNGLKVTLETQPAKKQSPKMRHGLSNSKGRW